MKELLEKLGHENSGAVMALGLEQEFFVIPKEAYLKRIDIRSTGRALVG
jgi:glutamine synthetase